MLVIGLILGFLGAIIVTLHLLHDLGIELVLKNVDKISQTMNEIDPLRIKIRNRENLTPVEKDKFIEFIKENVAFNSIIHINTIWLFFNRCFFGFTPWMEEQPIRVNRYLWNLLGGFLITVGFLLQLIDALKK